MCWKILQSLPQPLLIDWEPKCHHPGNLNTSSYTMVRLSGVGRDEITNLIKVVTVPFQGWAPSIGEVLIFHVPQCYTFTRAPCTLGNKHAFEGFLPSGLQEGASCGGEEKCLERYWMESVLVFRCFLCVNLKPYLLCISCLQFLALYLESLSSMYSAFCILCSSVL